MRAHRSFALVTAFLVLLSGQAFAAFADQVIRPATPTPVPPFVFVDEQGGQHALADYRGKYVLLNIWATWCAPCIREMPALDTLQPQFDARGFVILPVAEERAPFLVSAFYQRYALRNLPVMVDRAGVAPQRFGLRGLPVSILIDPQGNEVARIEGDADWASAEAVAFLDSEMGLPKR